MEAATLTAVRREWRPPATDDELVAATRANDDRAFEVLYARYQRRIAAYVLGMVKDHGRAEDVTQEVFVSALRRLRQTGGPIAFKPWIYEIAKNACIDQFRRSRRAEEVSFDAEEGVGPTLVSSRPGPEAELSSRMELDSLRSAFVGLTDTHHRILVMRELEGRSYAEIGQRMGLSRPAVESTLFRARKRLAEEYDELVSGERCRRVQAIIADAGAGRLGARDQRRMARHVSCCSPCRRALVAAGLGDVPAGVGAKIAALLPLPAFLRERWLGLGGHHAAAGSDAAAGGGAGALASWAHAAGPVLDAGGGGWLKAVATAATVAVAGVGANVVTSSHQAGVERAGDPGALVAAVSGRAASVGAPVSAVASRAAVPASVGARRVRSAATSAPTATRPARSRRATRSRRDRGGAGAGRPALATTAPAAGGTTTVSAPSTSGSGGSVGTTVHGAGSTGAGSGAGSGSGSGTRSGSGSGTRSGSGSGTRSGSGSGSGRTITPLERAAGDVTHAVSGAVGAATGAATTSISDAGSLTDQLPSTPVASLGDTPIQVPTTTDVIDTVDETVDQTVTGVNGVVGVVRDTTQDVGDTATGLTGGLLGG